MENEIGKKMDNQVETVILHRFIGGLAEIRSHFLESNNRGYSILGKILGPPPCMETTTWQACTCQGAQCSGLRI